MAVGAKTGVMAAQSGVLLPTRSLEFPDASSPIGYMYLGASAIASFNRAKWSLSIWVKRNTDAFAIFEKGDGSFSTTAFIIQYTATNKLLFYTWTSGSTIDGDVILNAGDGGAVGDWVHLLFHFDSANVTTTERIRIWVDGSEITTFQGYTAPTGQVKNVGSNFFVGYSPLSAIYNDGYACEYAFYNGYLVPIADVYDSGMIPVPRTNLTSALITNVDDPITQDAVLASAWTNAGAGPTLKSTDIPA